MWLLRTSVALLVAGSLTACPDDGRKETPEYRLAVIESGNTDLDPDHELVDGFDRALDDLEQRCRESRDRLADIAADTHQELADADVSLDLLEIIDQVNGSIDDGEEGDCAQVFRAYALLKTQGRPG